LPKGGAENPCSRERRDKEARTGFFKQKGVSGRSGVGDSSTVKDGIKNLILMREGGKKRRVGGILNSLYSGFVKSFIKERRLLTGGIKGEYGKGHDSTRGGTKGT